MYEHSVSESSSLKKNALYKILMFTLAFLIAFTAYIQSVEKAKAMPWAGVVPAGITVGTGVYVGAALVTAGIAGVIGYEENSEAINAHAMRAWGNGTTLAKESLNASIDLAKGTGNGVVSLSSGLINFFESKLQSISASSVELTQMNDPTIAQSINASVYRYATSTSFANAKYGSNYTAWASIDSMATGIFAMSLNADGSMQFKTTSININLDTTKIHGSAPWGSFSYPISNQATYDYYRSMIYSGMTASSIANVISLASGRSVVVGQYDDALYKGAVSRVREAWESMRDAGLVLPVDSAVPVTAEGNPLTFNPDTGAYIGIDGGVYEGVPGWVMPQPKWRTGTTDLPSGVYVDTPVLTGNPAYDTPILENPAIPKTTTNIYTGTTIANPDIPITPTPTPTPTPKPEPTAPKLPRVPGSQAPVPALIFMAFFDLLRALLMYLVRMFNWIMTIPFIDEKPIDNPYFQWFRQAKILGVYPYTLVCSMATFFLGFKLVKAVRSFLP